MQEIRPVKIGKMLFSSMTNITLTNSRIVTLFSEWNRYNDTPCIMMAARIAPNVPIA